MEAVRRVLITLWGIWGVLVFLITLILVTPVYLGILSFGGKRSQKWAHQLSRAWARILFGAFLVQVNVHHANQLAADEPYIFIANHTSLLDVPAKALATSHFFKFLAKQELTRVPLLGRIVKQLYVTVDRTNPRARFQSLASMQAALQAGTSVAIFPEGSRNRSADGLMRFHDGAFTLSQQTGYRLAVLTIIGSGERLPAGHFFRLKPGTIDCYWEGTLDPAAYQAEDTALMKTDARKMMLRRLKADAPYPEQVPA
jgi:1-acyl-sn-glycerol-3-phosphate acyltransferase